MSTEKYDVTDLCISLRGIRDAWVNYLDDKENIDLPFLASETIEDITVALKVLDAKGH